jgi:hypothetical protein
MTEFVFYSNGEKVSRLKLSREFGNSIFETEFWREIELKEYPRKESTPIEAVLITDDKSRLEMIEASLVAGLAFTRFTQRNSDNAEEGEVLLPADISILLRFLCDRNVDGIRIG